ncbi:MAG: substrate-binding domain-containing protein [Acidimicrobiales bacterium]
MTGATLSKRTQRARCSRRGDSGLLAVALVAVAAVVSSPIVPSASAGAATDRGPVTVLYAGSLTEVMEHSIGPSFEQRTGYTFSGMSAGSTAIVTEVKGELVRGDVFVSASSSADTKLIGASNGNWVRWYVEFGTTPLEIGYNPNSRFATALKTEPWYKVVTQPGFLLGRTDPATDPKGALAVTAIKRAAATDRDPALLSILQSTAGVYPEQTLVGRLQAGQLDAGFFYAAEAKAAGIPTVPLGHLTLTATYTATVLRNAPDPAGARAFVAFLLGPQGRRLLGNAGIQAVHPPRFVGVGAPASVTGAARHQ